MQTSFRTVAALVLIALAGSGGPAAAQITKADRSLGFTPSGTNSVAFNEWSNVSLVVAGPNGGDAGYGMFVGADGVNIGSGFLITDDYGVSGGFTGWYSVAAGGSSSDPVFLVTYLWATSTTNIYHRARLIRYRPGQAPLISAPIAICNTNGRWFATELGRNAWDGDRFVTVTYVGVTGGYPQPMLHHIDINGVVSDEVILGDYLDFYGIPSVACAGTEKLCLIVGFGAGYPFGPTAAGGSYFRLVNANNLQPITQMDYLETDHSVRSEDQAVIFNEATRQFLTTWLSFRTINGQKYWIDNRVIGLNGAKGPVAPADGSRSFGPGSGESRISYNRATATTLLISKWAGNVSRPYDFYAAELGNSGGLIRPSNIVRLMECWNGTDCPTPIFNPGITPNPANGSWFVDMWYTPAGLPRGLSWLVQGTTGNPPPPPPPAPTLAKASPPNGATGQGTATMLNWGAVTGATAYQYCIDTTNNSTCDSGWQSAGTALSAQITLLAGTTYYWQVTATVSGQTITGDGGAWWSLATGAVVTLPAFGKTAPATSTTLTGNSVTLSWATAPGMSYRVCVDTTNNGICDGGWVSSGVATSMALSDLAPGTYYWQVQAYTATALDADNGTWWSFTVPPVEFAKQSPADGASGLGSSVSIGWSNLSGASLYAYCVSRVATGCDSLTGWLDTGATSATISSLPAGTYYWQVVGSVGGRTVKADNGTWNSFTVGARAALFGKAAPLSGDTAPSGLVSLSWGAVSGAAFELCVDTTANNVCNSTWMSLGAATTTILSGLPNGTYYWQVRAATTARVDADAGTWWSFTVSPSGFAKQSPADGESGVGSSVTIRWSSLSGASLYAYCVSRVGTGCDSLTGWVDVAATSATVASLPAGTYYWQVVGAGSGGTVSADNGRWWSFVVGARDPGIIDMSPAGAPNGSWVFADGTLGQAAGFTTYYAIANENPDPVHVRGWLVDEDTGRVVFFELPTSIPGLTRQTVSLSAIVGTTAPGRYSAVFQSVPYAADNIPSGRQIYVARSGYWGGTAGIQSGAGHQKTGTLVAAGSSLPTEWYFAEGTRVWSPVGQFETYYTVFNPTQSAANVIVEFVGDRGEGVIRTVTNTVAAQTRWTLSASAYADLNARNFSVRVGSTNGVGVVAERPMYWGAAWEGGHAGAGGTATSRDWYFAEGTAQNGFDTYYTLLNPTTQAITVDATYQLSPLNGLPQAPVSRPYTLPPASRTTVYLYNEVGFQPGVAAEFHASGPIVAERSMYWGSPWTDGSTVSGAAAAAVEWHLPEGSTINGYETFLTLSNPNTSTVTVDVTTFSSAGVAETKTVTVGAKSRLTLWMNNTTPANGPVFSSIQNATFSLRVVSTGTAPLSIVAEESVYWNRLVGVGQYWRGGDAALGWPVIR